MAFSQNSAIAEMKQQESVNKCVQYVRQLAHLENFTSNFGHTTEDSLKCNMAQRNLELKSQDMSKIYDALHREINTLPEMLYPENKADPIMEAAAKFVDEASTDISVMRTFDATQDAMRQHGQAVLYADTCHSTLIAPLGNTKHRSIYVGEPDVPKFDGSNDIHVRQREFEKSLREGIARFNNKYIKNGKVTEKIHDKSVVHAIHELSVVFNRESFKLILLVTRGKIDHVNIYGANEDVKYLDDRRKKVDPYAPSQFYVFSSQIQFINHHFHVFESTQKKCEMETTILFLIQVAKKVLSGFTARCVSCKQVLKNGVLPVVSDIRKELYIHEECK